MMVLFVGQQTNTQGKKKIDFYAYMKDFLDFITRTYNMFCSMKFGEKIKCIIEMLIITIILFIGSNIVHGFFRHIIYGLIPVYSFWKIISIIIKTILSILSAIIFIHLFKIRYLDYFITVEDQNVTEKTIEEPIEKKEDKYYQEKKKEKIIIRDPKHSIQKFFDVLGNIIITMIKALAIFAIIPIIIAFIVTIGFATASIFYISYGILFLFVAISIIGVALLQYDFIELLYNFIVGREVHFKKLFIIGIAGLIMCGAGAGLAVSNYLNYQIVEDFEDSKYLVRTEEIEMTEDLYISRNYKYDYNIDNSVNNLKIEIKYIDGVNTNVNVSSNYCYFNYSIDSLNKFRIVMNDLKNKQIRNYDGSLFMKTTITTSEENYNKLQENYTKATENINILR